VPDDGIARADVPARRREPRPLLPPGTELAIMWALFLGIHFVLAIVNLYSASNPFADVTNVYRTWIGQAWDGRIPGIDTAFVYPLGALGPMALARLLGGPWPFGFGVAWLAIVTALDAIAFARLTMWRPAAPDAVVRRIAAWFWIVFLACLGPISLGRIDAMTIPLAVLAFAGLRRTPVLSAGILTIAAWLKVWTAAPFAVLVVLHRRRASVLASGAIVSLAIVAFAIAAGGWPNVLSFVSEQTGRGLQVESPAAIVPLWLAVAGNPEYHVAYSYEILTVQVSGPGTDLVSNLLTPLMVGGFGGVLVLAAIARRRGTTPYATLLPAAALGATTALILFNKVGSPQFIGWLGPVVVLGLIMNARRFVVPAGLVLVIAAVTQIVYPWDYGAVMSAHVEGAWLLTIRNGLELALFAWCVWALRPRTVAHPAHRGPRSHN